nr:MAG TPA: hypothetical protein [Bacteriophage sp.]
MLGRVLNHYQQPSYRPFCRRFRDYWRKNGFP